MWEALVALPWQPKLQYKYVLLSGTAEDGEPMVGAGILVCLSVCVCLLVCVWLLSCFAPVPVCWMEPSNVHARPMPALGSGRAHSPHAHALAPCHPHSQVDKSETCEHVLALPEGLKPGDVVEVLDTWVDHSYPGSILTSAAFTKVGGVGCVM